MQQIVFPCETRDDANQSYTTWNEPALGRGQGVEREGGGGRGGRSESHGTHQPMVEAQGALLCHNNRGLLLLLLLSCDAQFTACWPVCRPDSVGSVSPTTRQQQRTPCAMRSQTHRGFLAWGQRSLDKTITSWHYRAVVQWGSATKELTSNRNPAWKYIY